MKIINANHKQQIVSTVAVAGMLSLGIAPAWAQQRGESSSSRQSATAAADGMIAANDLRGHTVLDSNNREIGTIEDLFIDLQSGRVQRADIDFSIGTDETYSVKWDQLKVKSQGKDLVISLDPAVVQRVQQAGANRGTMELGDRYGQQQQRDSDHQLGAGTAATGAAGNTNKEEKRISAAQMSAAQIRKIQQELNKQGFDAGQVNGQWRSDTQAALKNFQQSKGLKATGQLDERTINELGVDVDDLQQQSQSENGNSSSQQQSNQGSTRW
jgi:sporulation protein YlmC with PRC-barrel domain